MTNLKDYLELFEDVTRVEKIMISIKIYNITRGGGILWIFLYWLLFIFSVIEVLKFSHGVPNIIESIGFTGLFIIGWFLVYGVFKQMSIMRRWYKQLFRDYCSQVQSKVKVLMDECAKDVKFGSQLQQELISLRDSLSGFERVYFPKKDRNKNSL